MADRVGFALGEPTGLLAHFLEQPLEDFCDWYVDALSEYPDDFDAARLDLLGCLLEQGASIVAEAKPVDVNALVMDYYSSYANVHDLIPEINEYWDMLVYQEMLVARLRAAGYERAADLLRFTVFGRLPVDDPTQTLSHWTDYQLSFLTAAEVVELSQALDAMEDAELEDLLGHERVVQALFRTRTALEEASAFDTGLIVFVGW